VRETQSKTINVQFDKSQELTYNHLSSITDPTAATSVEDLYYMSE